MERKFDIFISYATQDRDIAFNLVNKIESRGKKCFIAPRDIRTGYDYASEIVHAISNSDVMLVLLSPSSDKSGYCLREINSAVSKNLQIMPIKIEDVCLSEAMEFYLGPAHWLDATSGITDSHIESILNTVASVEEKEHKEILTSTNSSELKIVRINDAVQQGFSYKDILIKEIELDYLNVPVSKFTMNEDINGSFSDWESVTTEYEIDTSCLAILNNEIVGYCDFYPVNDEDYVDLIGGKCIIRDSMIALYDLGGEFNAYIAMLAFTPELSNQKAFIQVFKWLKTKIFDWEADGVILKNIGISIYNNLLEKIVLHLGFEFKCLNPAKGKVYEINAKKLIDNLSKIK